MEFIFFLLINIVRIYKWAILARVLLSWVSGPRPTNSITLLLYQATEPVLSIFRGILPRTGMIDFSPLIAFIALDFFQMGLLSLLQNLT